MDGELVTVRPVPARQAGKGGAFVRTKLKNLTSGAVVDRTFRAGEKFPRVTTESRRCSTSTEDGDDARA